MSTKTNEGKILYFKEVYVMRESRVYGYCRISTPKQRIERQVDNIKSKYPDAVIFTESFTGTKMNRPEWMRLIKQVRSGDTIVFDEISRMSRNAEEGYQTYKDLYDQGINLVFLKESPLNTENYKKTMQIAMTNSDLDVILEGVNKYLMILAENQIRAAFETAEHEVRFLHQRTKEGVLKAQASGKKIGIEKGRKLITKKSVDAKIMIIKNCKDFDGDLTDQVTLAYINQELNKQRKGSGLSRNSYFKYKAEIKAELLERMITYTELLLIYKALKEGKVQK